MKPIDQLRKFVEFDKMCSPDKTHIASWALSEIERLTANIQEEAVPVAYHYKYSTDLHKDVWGVGYNVPANATEHYPLGRMSPEPESAAVPDESDFIGAASIQETADTDALLTHLGLDRQTYRTDGGWLNLPKIKAALKDPEMYPHIAPQAREMSDDELSVIAKAHNYHFSNKMKSFARAVLAARDAQQTMNDRYGDGSDHIACGKCGKCVSCGDCDCTEPQARKLSDDEEFDALCREHDIQGTAEARLCRVFWLAARDAK